MTCRQARVRSGRRVRTSFCLAFSVMWGLLTACSSGDNNGPGPTNTGQACTAVEQCFPGVQDGDLLGEAVCLDKITGGYCTHYCTQDSDCCATAGECANAHAEVCGPFESTGEMYCFLGCEDADVSTSGYPDSDRYCQAYAGSAFRCHSTGGGSKNRKVCTP